MTAGVLSSLCRSNAAILSQKLALIDSLIARHGPVVARDKFTLVCPIAGASIGQHFRHSMDHVELAALVAVEAAHPSNGRIIGEVSSTTGEVDQQLRTPEIHYDLRVRGGTLERDVDESRKRIVSVAKVFDDLSTAVATGSEEGVGDLPVWTNFFLSADERGETALKSTIARELGFAAHHAIHHMAMVKIIATHSVGLSEDDLPENFGKAPSTVKYGSTLE
uniref:DinB-like domain-containing protein n=1 Tax=Trieres chinensis TaxID=1514140 RepID=A0A7S1Z2V2_TRICV|eukprot:CAMPEP_0183308974 /NCGR_PEP_ID=MMETSP0160_2-20130417/23303_1 /TAXON_ID=2839 ORGANISM="Odontella Sinensis, Strain Grunow 1884" /NCGR_SAMPLE_ID=MMETSP0160_2 /ASSEMBLY_ACC=CAM_ASM_000250 /LENGTH=220 /DNA_ID=CAMNT_0025472901 /DNA_START=52 /DNA_END=717 /DNA_ORIENTATION=-